MTTVPEQVDEPECYVSRRALDDLHRDGSHVGTKTVIWNCEQGRNSKPRVPLYRRPQPAEGWREALEEARDYIIGLGQSPEAEGWPRDQYAVLAKAEAALSRRSAPAALAQPIADAALRSSADTEETTCADR